MTELQLLLLDEPATGINPNKTLMITEVIGDFSLVAVARFSSSSVT